MINKNNVTKIVLPESDIPKYWYNIVADMKNAPEPYYNPQTGEKMVPADMEAIFPKSLIEQELSKERYIEIPEEVRGYYQSFRPSPLYRARGLEKALDTPARIYYKYEGGNATGSHKLNTALAQVYYNKEAGIKRLATETGAGQWGCALSMATQMMGLDCTVYMVKVSYNQKPYRRDMMQIFGGTVYASPSEHTNNGRAILAKDPNCNGALGIAISEAVEDAVLHNDTNYALGSVLNHVCLHQTIIGQEAKRQMEVIDEYPDIVFACCGGGSNFSGMAFPFLQDKLTGKSNVQCVAVEPMSCPTLTKGVYDYDYGDTAKMAPIAKMYTLGHDFMPPAIHSGGLRYHGAGALISQLYHEGEISARAYGQLSVFDAAVFFAKAEGIVPAPESSHAICAAIDEAERCKESGEEKVILFCLSGNGYFDMTAYENYLSGKMQDSVFDESALQESLQKLPDLKK